MLAGQINTLFMPVFNKDTTYFSNVVASYSRDAYCFVAQSNSNHFGDSRITAPKHTFCSNLISLKGGLNNYYVIGQIDVGLLMKEGNDYEDYISRLNSGTECDELENKEFKPLSAGNIRYK